ncbi:MAG TPA: phage/plasmid primase, P4 family [Bryobacteraceae bacterium]|nr:phage/plasmid primase, P4 family [Bryobacteraceae bacterium]
MALAAWRGNRRRFAGIGFVFSSEDSYVGIDLDDCLEGGQLKPWAQSIVQKLADTYMEISPSGNGIKIWAKARLAGPGKKAPHHDGAIEIYDRGRYFSVTGRVFNGAPMQVKNHQADVNRLYALLTGGTAGKTKSDISDTATVFEGSRHSYLASIAAQFGARGMAFEEVFAATQAVNQSRCKPPKPDKEVRDICQWVWKRERCKQVVQMRGGDGAGPVSPAGPGDPPRSGTGKTHTAELADEITRQASFARDAGGRLYVFKDGVYNPSGELFVQQRVKGIMNRWGNEAKWTSRKAKEVCEYIRVDAPALWDAPPKDVVNLQNGLLQVHTRELIPHSPKFLSPVQVPIRFDPAAKCPALDQFIAEVFPGDSEAIAWELAAWLITPDTSIQKAVLLTGEGANGKSTYLRALVAFVGKHNTSAVSLHRLEQDKFAVARLVGKLANICPDLPSAHLASTSMFKAITGGDVLHGEYKYLDSFEFVPYAKLVFSANQPPRSDDPTHGFFRRWLVVPFMRTFDEGTSGTLPREVLDARLSEPAELSGVLVKALYALEAIRKRGGFTESESMKRAWSEFRTATDPLSVWLDCNTVDVPTAIVAKSDLMAAFNRHCTDTGRPPLTKSAFGLALERARPAIHEGQRTIHGRLQWVYLGLGLRIEPVTEPSGA